jgi:hypothetical protein
MSKAMGLIRGSFTAGFGLASWLAGEQMALAQVILAQSGVAKTMIGWLLVFLAIGLGLLVVCRPSGRKAPDSDK